jgi:hypothetical protein
VLLCAGQPAKAAEEAPPPSEALAEEAAPEEGERSLWKQYTDFWDTWIERALDLDLYGGTAQLPQGLFGFKVDWNMRRAVGRYDNHRKRTAMVQPIVFGGDDNPLLVLDLGAEGEGGGITLQFSYGITDPLDFYIEVPLQYMRVSMRPKLSRLDPFAQALINGYMRQGGYPESRADWFDENGMVRERYLNEAAQWFVGYLPRLGRPGLLDPAESDHPDGPGKEFDSGGAVLGDINLGFSWNYLRNARWSGAFTGRVYLPTGRLADPNNALTLGTGPDIDAGVGSFGFGFTKGFDVRVFQYSHWISIVASAEFTAAYRFKQKRRYPDFPAPTADGNQLLNMLDPERMYFPDMHDLSDKSYSYTPGFGCSAQVGLSIGVLIFDFAAAIGYSFAQEPELNADWRFEQMVKALEMQAAGHYEILRLAAGVNLLPFYVPLQLHYQYEKNIGGRNTLIFDQNHWVTIKGYIPTY